MSESGFGQQIFLQQLPQDQEKEETFTFGQMKQLSGNDRINLDAGVCTNCQFDKMIEFMKRDDFFIFVTCKLCDAMGISDRRKSWLSGYNEGQREYLEQTCKEIKKKRKANTAPKSKSDNTDLDSIESFSMMAEVD